MTSTRPLRFLHRESVVEIGRMSPMTTVLDWLRLDQRLTGTLAATVNTVEPRRSTPASLR